MSTVNHLFDIQGTLGALFIGLLVSCVLFGIVTLQAYLYYTNFPEDGLRLKALVAFVWICELGHCICVCHATYYLVIVGYGNPTFLIRMPGSLCLAIAFSGIIGTVVQMFFAERIRVISGGKLIIPVFCWTVSTLRLTLSIITSIKAIQMTTLINFQTQWEWLLTTVLSVGVAVDVVIAASLCYYLSKAKDRLMKRTAQKLDKLMLWTIQTGLLTSVTTVILITFFLIMPRNFAWIAIFMSLARLFSNSLLASLNARIALRTNNNNHAASKASATASHGISNTSVTNWNNGTVKPSHIVINMSTLSEVGTGDSKMDETSAMVV